MGEMSKLDSKVVGFREAEGSVFLSRNLLELTKKRSFKSHDSQLVEKGSWFQGG